MIRNSSWMVLGCLLATNACSTGSDPTTSSVEEALRRSGKIVEVVTQENTVSSNGRAAVTDQDLVNAWGLAFNPNPGIAWIAANKGAANDAGVNGPGTLRAYDDEGVQQLVVTIPSTEPAAPTGLVFNQFLPGNPMHPPFKGDVFISVGEDGLVSGWQAGMVATIRVTPKVETIYKGATLGVDNGKPFLFATDFHNNKIDVFDENYEPVTVKGFVDHRLPKGFAPFNVLAKDDFLFVTYALQDNPADAEDDAKGPGNGFVDVYKTDGRLVERLISRGALNSPWGLAFKDIDKKKDGKDKDGKDKDKDKEPVELLVGNFGDGRINVYKLSNHGFFFDADFQGPVFNKATHQPLVIDGLWALVFGPGTDGFDADDLYFTAGPNDENAGLFGELGFD